MTKTVLACMVMFDSRAKDVQHLHVLHYVYINRDRVLAGIGPVLENANS